MCIPSEARSRLRLWDDLLAFNITVLFDRVAALTPEEQRQLAGTCARIIAGYGDTLLFPTGSQHAFFRLYPPDVLWQEGQPLRRWVTVVGADGTPVPNLVPAPDASPLLYGEFSLGQVMAIGLLCIWLLTPTMAAQGAYGPTRLFPGAAAAFRQGMTARASARGKGA